MSSAPHQQMLSTDILTTLPSSSPFIINVRSLCAASTILCLQFTIAVSSTCRIYRLYAFSVMGVVKFISEHIRPSVVSPSPVVAITDRKLKSITSLFEDFLSGIVLLVLKVLTTLCQALHNNTNTSQSPCLFPLSCFNSNLPHTLQYGHNDIRFRMFCRIALSTSCSSH